MTGSRGTLPGHGTTPRVLLAFGRDARVDLKYALRLFARQPAILLLTILGLSLGLGIATAAFSIMNAALRGEGLVDPGRAPGVLRATDRSLSTSWSYDEFLRLREGATRMQVEAVLTDTAPARAGTGEAAASPAGVAFVSGGFFAATGGGMSLGRSLAVADEQQTGPPPIVVSHVFWSTVLNRDPGVIGRPIRIGRTEARVVGVAKSGFTLPSNRQIWMPLTSYGAVYDAAPLKRTPDMGVQVFGRLLPGATLPDAEAQLSGVAAGLPRVPAAGERALRVKLATDAGLGRVSSSDTLEITLMVFGVIVLVLLLACANVATVLVSTAITRDREMAVRAALGASRGRILRQLVTESLAMGGIAAALGLLFAHWAIPIIGTMIEAPAGTDLSPSLAVYRFLGIVTVLSGVVAGLAPAWHSRGSDLVTPLKGAGPAQGRVPPWRLRSLLVMTQAAVSVLLLVVATLFMRATVRAGAIDVGFDAAGLYAVDAGLGDPFGDEAARARNRSFWARAIPDLQAVPGIASVALSEMTPFGGLTRTSITRGDAAHIVDIHRAQSTYFETMGLRIVAGRAFTRDEVAGGAPVALVSQSLARAFWHGQSPLGRMLPAEIPLQESARPVVIGVVADAIMARLHERGTFALYQPLDAESEGFAQLLIRTAPGATHVVERARQRLLAVDPLSEVRIAGIESRLEQEAGRPRMLATLTGFIGVVAIVLCVIGLYGLTASVVLQRTREMGVRAALGAAPGSLLRLLLWDSLRPIVAGLAIGAATALLAGRVVAAAVFFGVSPQDPMALAGAALALLASAALAVWVPTRRAAAVDAAVVLRQS
ncbi:MAG TPA: ABC transporter permease [Candidatus Polarisedimenticolia bacterium]|nr:ABC transporter permease [Candidatus Polarisedimenticolia bacterium]